MLLWKLFNGNPNVVRLYHQFRHLSKLQSQTFDCESKWAWLIFETCDKQVEANMGGR